MSEQAKQYTLLGGALIRNGVKSDKVIGNLYDKADFEEIVLNAQEAHAFDVMVERGWRVREVVLNEDETERRWDVIEFSGSIAGFGPTPLAAIADAERRTKGGA